MVAITAGYPNASEHRANGGYGVHNDIPEISRPRPRVRLSKSGRSTTGCWIIRHANVTVRDCIINSRIACHSHDGMGRLGRSLSDRYRHRRQTRLIDAALDTALMYIGDAHVGDIARMPSAASKSHICDISDYESGIASAIPE